MKKSLLLFFLLSFSIQAKAWWDAGHLVTAMIAYHFLDDDVKEKMDEYVQIMARDYDHVNHFVTLAAWPDDIKGEDVRCYNTMHYTNIPYNPHGVALPPKQHVDVIWAIKQAQRTLNSDRARPIEKARQLAFLTHFVGDIHQPLHSTTMYTNEQPGGDAGGNFFALEGKWANMHKLWDDGCGYLSDFNDISPYGEAKQGLDKGELERLQKLASDLIKQNPPPLMDCVDNSDPDFWALESHKLAVKYGYRGVVGKNEKGRYVYIEPGTTPSEYYLAEGQRVVRERLVMGGYRLAQVLNEIFAAPGQD